MQLTIPKPVIWCFIIFSLIGFLDASYLTASHYLNSAVPCTITKGCETVLTSKYSTVLGIPVALAGSFYYFLVFIFSLFIFFKPKNKIGYLALYLSPIGLIASLWFLYLQLFVIKSICQYCMVSAFICIVLFALFIFVIRYRQKKI